MQMRRLICTVLACMLTVGTIAIPVSAAEVETTPPEISTINIVMPAATESFNISIPANSQARADSSFPLAAGETVTIKASYSPFSASVDFGLIAPDGKFYCFNITNGSINKTIQVDASGDYTFQVRNNSNYEVEVSGFVNY